MAKFKVLVGDTTTPQARVPKKGTEEYQAPVTLSGSSGHEVAFELETTVEQSGSAGYSALKVNVIENSIGPVDNEKYALDVTVDTDRKFLVDNNGAAFALGGLVVGSLSNPLGSYPISGSEIRINDPSGTTLRFMVNDVEHARYFTNVAQMSQYIGTAGTERSWKATISGGSCVQQDWYVNNDIKLTIDTTGLVTAPLLKTETIIVGTAIEMELSGGPSITTNFGSPEGVFTAAIGSLYMRRDGGAGTSLYVKESGIGNTGWVAK